MAGRRPKSGAQQKGSGNAGKRKGRRDIRPAAAGPEAPPWVRADKVALAEWNALVPERLRLKIHTRLDVNQFGRYCVLMALWLTALERVRAEGLFQGSAKTGELKKHPAWMILLEMDKDLRALEIENGATPASRRRLGTPEAVPEATEELVREFFKE